MGPRRPFLVLFCGIPGSGKTTVAAGVALELQRCVHVQTDQVRAMVARPEYDGVESRFVYGAAVAVGGAALRSGYDVILDATFGRREYRSEALDGLEPLSSRVMVVHVFCDLGTALARNASRRDPVPEETLTRIQRSFEPPGGAFEIDTSRLTPDEAVALVVGELRRLEEGSGSAES
jgi:predicted kinase